MSRRRKARRYALQILFSLDIAGGEPDTGRMAEFWADKNEPEELKAFTESLVVGVCNHRDELDEALKQTAANWALERMAAVDRSLLRLAAYELLFRPDIPNAVSINEALEIAKEFSTFDSASFINGLLDQIARRAMPGAEGKGPLDKEI